MPLQIFFPMWISLPKKKAKTAGCFVWTEYGAPKPFYGKLDGVGPVDNRPSTD